MIIARAPIELAVQILNRQDELGSELQNLCDGCLECGGEGVIKLGIEEWDCNTCTKARAALQSHVPGQASELKRMLEEALKAERISA